MFGQIKSWSYERSFKFQCCYRSIVTCAIWSADTLLRIFLVPFNDGRFLWRLNATTSSIILYISYTSHLKMMGKRKLEKQLASPSSPGKKVVTPPRVGFSNLEAEAVESDDSQLLIDTYDSFRRGDCKNWDLVFNQAVCKNNCIAQAIIAIFFSTPSARASMKESLMGAQFGMLCLESLQNAALNSKWADVLLGEFHFNGIAGLAESASRAVLHYRNAAIEGVAFAQFRLGYCLYHGQGIEKNIDEAYAQFALAANQGLQIRVLLKLLVGKESACCVEMVSLRM